MKKNLYNFALLLAFIPYVGYAQTYTNQATVTSYGGGQANGGNLNNFIVIGESLVTSSSIGANTELKAGFIFTNTDELFLTPCPTPVDLSATITGQDVALVWSDEGTDTYTVRYRVKGASVWEIIIPSPTTNTASLSGLESGTTYQFRVKSNCAPFESPFSEKSEFVTEGPPACEIPTGIVVSNIGDNGATITWDNNATALAYDVRYRISGNTPWNLFGGITGESTDLTGLFPGSIYQVKVRSDCSIDGSLKSLYSDNSEFTTTGVAVCEIPSGFTITEESNPGDVTIGWNAAFGASSYEIRYKIKNTQGYSRLETADATSSVLLSGLAEGVTYVFSVRSLCSTDGSLVSAYSANDQFVLTNGVTTCETPINIASALIDDNSVTISWDPVASADRYAYRYRVKGSSSWINDEAVSNAALTELNAGTTYQFMVRSICDASGSLVSDYSPKIEFITTGTSVCITPTGITVSAIADNSATVDWADAGGAVEYEVRYKITGTPGWIIQYTTLSNLDLTGLLSGMPYRVKIRSICTPDRSFLSAFSGIETFTTTGASACNVPVNLQSLNETTTGADLSWDIAGGALQYEVRYKIQGTSTWNIVFPTNNSETLADLDPNTQYRWKVRSICALDNSIRSSFSGTSSFFTTAPALITLLSPERESSLQTYPNPFGDRLFVKYYFPDDGFLSIKMYSIMGKIVGTIYEGYEIQGSKRYEFTSGDLQAGVYLIKAMSLDGSIQIQRIVLSR